MQTKPREAICFNHFRLIDAYALLRIRSRWSLAASTSTQFPIYFCPTIDMKDPEIEKTYNPNPNTLNFKPQNPKPYDVPYETRQWRCVLLGGRSHQGPSRCASWEKAPGRWVSWDLKGSRVWDFGFGFFLYTLVSFGDRQTTRVWGLGFRVQFGVQGLGFEDVKRGVWSGG